MSGLPEQRHEPFWRQPAIVSVTGQIAAEDFFLVEQPANENGHDKNTGGQGEE
jgi:hypothetical protein